MYLEDMKIYIITTSHLEELMFKSMFDDCPNVEVVKNDFESFMKKNPDVECIVSPANCYGIMDGGYDAAISNYLGWDFQRIVQKYIIDNFYGEQIVGTSFIIDCPYNKKLIHTPTMIMPEKVIDNRIVYTAMRSTLICALKNNIKSIVIPLFGAGTGKVGIDIVCKHMRNAYEQIYNAENGDYGFYDEFE